MASPAEPLTVRGNIRSQTTNESTTNIITRAFSDGSSIRYGVVEALRDAVGSLPLLLNPTGGNVGIGTTTPANKLTVIGDIGIGSNSKLGGGNGYGVTAANFASLEMYNGSTGQTTLNNQGYAINLQTAGTTRLHITNGGNVGIGTSAPAYQLHIHEPTTGGSLIKLSNSQSGITGTDGLDLAYLHPDAYLINREVGKMFFRTSNNDRLLIDASGLVGINETTLSAQLTVKSGAVDRVGLIVNTIASHTTSLQLWQVNGSNRAFIDNSGRLRTPGISGTALVDSFVETISTGTVISRNIANSDPALIVNQIHASSTGHIQVWQSQTVAQAHITRTGIFVGQSRPTRTDITANATLALADEGKVLRVNPTTAADDITITVPPNSGAGSVAFPIDTEIAIVRYNSGTVTIVAGSGVTINSKNGNNEISGQYGSVALKKVATDEWVLVGSLE
jgi:hypothetical protein